MRNHFSVSLAQPVPRLVIADVADLWQVLMCSFAINESASKTDVTMQHLQVAWTSEAYREKSASSLELGVVADRTSIDVAQISIVN